MNSRRLLSNIVIAFSAQGISLIVSAAMSLLVPKVMGVEEYGYWQLFIFYSSYSGFFHLGLNDGVYLLMGGKTRNKVNKRILKSQFYVGLVFQLMIALAIVVYAFVLESDNNREFVLCASAIYLLLYNAAGYLGFLFQALNETRLYSFSCMLDRVVFFLPMLFMVLTGIDDYRAYVVLYGFSKGSALIFCLWYARDFLSANRVGIRGSIVATMRSISVGINLMLANIADMLILGVARALVDLIWGIEVFGKVSLSLSLVNYFIAFVTQASMVLFPTLRQSTHKELRTLFAFMRSTLRLFLPATYILYLPIAGIICFWLPQYKESIEYFAILMPLCVFSTKMNLLGSTFLKVLRRERILLELNIAAVIASTVSTICFVCVGRAIIGVLLAISIVITIRCIVAEGIVARCLGVDKDDYSLSDVVLSGAFIVFLALLGDVVGAIAYVVVYALYLLSNWEELKMLILRISRSFNGCGKNG